MPNEVGRQNFFKKSFEKPLTKSPRCAILDTSDGERQFKDWFRTGRIR